MTSKPPCLLKVHLQAVMAFSILWKELETKALCVLGQLVILGTWAKTGIRGCSGTRGRDSNCSSNPELQGKGI